MSVTLKPADPSDEDFLFQLYGSTRAEEMAAWGLDKAQRESFLSLQYRARRTQYESSYPDSVHRIILLDDRPVGRILTEEGDKEFCLVDIALLPEQRGAGIGATLIRDLQRRAGFSGKPVVLSVAKDNPAVSLYERLGFSATGDDGVYLRMRWSPDDGIAGS